MMLPFINWIFVWSLNYFLVVISDSIPVYRYNHCLDGEIQIMNDCKLIDIGIFHHFNDSDIIN
jgi:hypothetical protein